MDYLLETSTCSVLMAHVPRVIAHFDSLSDDDDYVFTCTIVKGEILLSLLGDLANLVKSRRFDSVFQLSRVPR